MELKTFSTKDGEINSIVLPSALLQSHWKSKDFAAKTVTSRGSLKHLQSDVVSGKADRSEHLQITDSVCLS